MFTHLLFCSFDPAVGREGGHKTDACRQTSADEKACQGGDRHPRPRFSASAQGLWPWPAYFGPKFRRADLGVKQQQVAAAAASLDRQVRP
eukprot:1785802-Prymnesium_polylepis.1